MSSIPERGSLTKRLSYIKKGMKNDCVRETDVVFKRYNRPIVLAFSASKFDK